ncbi:MAG: hypothetical protein HYU69_11075 [Bacteroidetes bacterium]|nr:hypothetical protein [Bacteroidota bacterium]
MLQHRTISAAPGSTLFRIVIYSLFLSVIFLTSPAFASRDLPVSEDQILQHIQDSPVHFFENKGQMVNTDNIPVPFVLFKASAPGIDVYITETGLTYVFAKIDEKDGHNEIGEKYTSSKQKIEIEKNKIEMAWINMRLKGTTIKKENIIMEGEGSAHYNYFFSHCPDGIYDVKQYSKITVRNIYPGIDWVLYNSNANGFKYDFLVHAGADPSQIKLCYESDKPLVQKQDGSLEINTPLGTLTENAPYSYLKESDTEIQTTFLTTITDLHFAEVSFKIEAYNSLRSTLVIDPQLLWGTYIGGTGGSISNEGTMDIVVDGNNNVYACGYVVSTNFPTLNPGGGVYYDNTLGSSTDGLILKFNNAGVLLWCTFYGGSDTNENLQSIASDVANNIYITGVTPSLDFPTQNLAGAYNDNTNGGSSDVVMLKFSPAGVRLWASYFGGTGMDMGWSIKTDATNSIYVTGFTSSANFPTQNLAGAYNDNAIGGGQDIFILKFNSSCALQWSTLFGGSLGDEVGNALWVGAGNNLFVTGYTNSTDFPLQNLGGAYNDPVSNGNNDVFVLKFNNTGALQWSTYLGGNIFDEATDIEEDVFGNLYVTGKTVSSNFPTQNLSGAYNNSVLSNGNTNGYDLFLCKFNSSCSMIWSTFIGGSASDVSHYTANFGYRTKNLVTDFCGVVYLGGWTGSNDFPTVNTCGTFFNNARLGPQDLVLVEFAATGAMIYSTYFGTLGGSQDFRANLALDNNRNLFITGEWMGASSNAMANPGGGAFNNNYTSADDIYFIKLKPDTASYIQTQVNATGCTCGNATIQINCGTPPYNYVWSNGSQLINSISTTNSIGLCAGNYWVEVTDAACNRDTIYYTLTGPVTGLALTITNTNPATCSSNGNSTAWATVTGGASPYTYTWNNGQTAQNASGLAAGNYTLTITDKTGCTATQTVSITLPAGPVINTTSTNNGCNSTGSASVIASIGTQPFTFSWSSGQTGTIASGLVAGGYTVTVTDGNGCTQTKTFNITGVNPVSATFTYPQTCVGMAVIFTNTGSTGTYSWVISPITPTNVSGTTSNFTYTFLTAGTYSVSHTVSSGGCSTTQTSTITVINCNGPVVTAVGSSVCQGSCASVTSSGTGGTVPYSYSWSNGWTIQNINPCPSSTTTYTVTITDSGGATSTSTALVIVNPIVVSTTTATNITCNGGTGSATVTGAGGSLPYTYSWSGGVPLTGSQVSGLAPGNYTVTLTDSKGCTSTSVTTIISPPSLLGQFAKGTANCGGCGCKEWVIVTAEGGTGPYSYSWPDGYLSRYKNQLCPGSYNINIKDKNGCSINVNLTTP